MKLRVLKTFNAGGRQYQPGQTFETEHADSARVLVEGGQCAPPERATDDRGRETASIERQRQAAEAERMEAARAEAEAKAAAEREAREAEERKAAEEKAKADEEAAEKKASGKKSK